ncbi:DJ-1/PfpI family protein [Bremerella cremea]|uniref:DJ-1/PfpI family protein n=1 Tax=Bremerella cremea TaxID=1031537 RepID=UPI0031ED7C79
MAATVSPEPWFPADQPIRIGALIFPDMDQMDLTGPYSVLCRLTSLPVQLFWKTKESIRDQSGLRLSPDASLAEAEPLDLLLVPGGYGQQALMNDDAVLEFVARQSVAARLTFSVCTGSLICGAAGLLQGKKATTHWTALHLLKYFGAIPTNERVVVDGDLVTAAGLTSGIDGALRVAAMLRGEEVARQIQLAIQYAPEPPFSSGSPEVASPETLAHVREQTSGITSQRLATAIEVARRLGIDVSDTA